MGTDDLVPAKRTKFIATDSDKKLVAKIEARRKSLKLTQEQLAKKLGLHVVTFNRYMNLHRGFSGQDLMKLEQILGPLREGYSIDDGRTTALQVRDNTELSDPRSRMPPGLEAFLERHGNELAPHEPDLLRRASHLADPTIDTSSDEFWWDYVRTVLRKYFRPPGARR